MSEPSLPISFEPDYGPVVTRVLPAIVGMMGLCGIFSLSIAATGTALWLGIASFGVGGGFLGLYLWYLIYRRIEFREERIIVRRYLFPDREGRFEQVSGLSASGFRLGGFPVVTYTMKDGAELRALLEDLIEQDIIEPAGEEGLSQEITTNLTATLQAAALGTVLWAGLEWVGLLPAFLPKALTSYVVIVITLLIGAPLLKRLSGA